MRIPVLRQRESIYRGMNGRTVERVWLRDGTTRILKPCDREAREIWVYEQVLPLFPPIYPHLESKWEDESGSGTIWMLFEDIGVLRHPYSMQTALDVIRHMVWWHTRPNGMWPDGPVQGLKPVYGDMAADLLAFRAGMTDILDGLGVEPGLTGEIYRRLESGDNPADGAPVFSHGDLHVGNYTHTSGGLYILDWEHAHLNSRYWDLFHVIDLTHPLYPRTDAPGWRMQLLDAYVMQAEAQGVPIELRSFLRGYHWFAAVFSLWMLRLIRSDLAAGSSPWNKKQLMDQQTDTERIFLENLSAAL